MDDGAVRSVDITYRGFPETLHARCVVVACGGFQANLDWMRQYWGDAVDNFVIRGTPYNRGRVLRNLLDQGVGRGRRSDAVPRRGAGRAGAEIRRRHHHAPGQRAVSAWC